MLEAGNSALSLCHVTQALVPRAALLRQRRKDAHIRAHGLEVLVLGGEILDKRTAHGVDGRCGQLFALETGVNVPRRQQAAGRALHIALEAGDLACKEDVGVLLEAEPCAQHPGCVEEGVAVHDAVADELRIPQRRDHGKDALLLAKRQVRLEADNVIQRAPGVVAPELHDGIVVAPGARVAQADRLERAVAQRVLPAAGHDLDRHAALKDVPVLEAVNLRLLGVDQLLPEGQILLPVHGAVDVVRRPLVVPGRDCLLYTSDAADEL